MNYAVASLIGQETWQRILEFLPESREIISHQKNNEFAHVSWVVSKQLNAPQVEKSLKSIAKRQPPLRFNQRWIWYLRRRKTSVYTPTCQKHCN